MKNRTDYDLTKELNKGLINWYPFEENAKILYTEECDFDNNGIAMIDGKYDYIVAIRDIEKAKNPVEVISEYRKHLNKKGHLFMAVENRFAMRYFCGDQDTYTMRSFDGIEGYRSYNELDKTYLDGRLYAKYEIDEMLKEVGVESRKFYSILPGLDMPQQIYAEDYLPNENIAIRFTPIYNNPSSQFLSEIYLYDEMIKNGTFHQFAGAYLVDIAEDNIYYEINTVTTSMDRGREHAMATIIEKDNVVVKKALYAEGKPGITALIENTKALTGVGVKCVHMTTAANGRAVQMDYIKAPTALEYFLEIVKSDKDRFERDLTKFIDYILKSSTPSEIQENKEFGVSYKRGYLDMVPHNAFYVEEDFVFFDQEFCTENYPVNAIIQRTLDVIYGCDPIVETVIPKEYFEKKYGLYEKRRALTGLGWKFTGELRNTAELEEFYKKHGMKHDVLNSNRQRINYSDEEYKKLFVDIFDDLRDKTLYIFGSGLWAKKYIAQYATAYTIEAAIDNDSSKVGLDVDGVRIVSSQLLKEIDPSTCKIIICVSRFRPIIKQLKGLGFYNFSVYNPNIEKADAYTVSCMTQQKEDVDGRKEELELQEKTYDKGYVAGVFDLFHIGHLNILKRAKEHCNYLIVGVVSDEQASGKDRSTYVKENERLEIVRACKYVDEAFIIPIEACDTKDVYGKYHFDVQFSGSDYADDLVWLEKQSWLRKRGADLVFFPYTEGTSSTKLKEAIGRKA